MKYRSQVTNRLAVCLLTSVGVAVAQEAAPPTSIPLTETMTPVFGIGELVGKHATEEAYANFRLVLEYDAPEAGWLDLRGDHGVELPAGEGRTLEILYEHMDSDPAYIRMWLDGKMIASKELEGTEIGGAAMVADATLSKEVLRMDRDFTAMVRFKAGENGGALFSKTMPEGKWSDGAKALQITKDGISYRFGDSGTLNTKAKLKPEKEHVAVMVRKDDRAALFLNGKKLASEEITSSADSVGSVFKIGAAADSGEDFDGEISNLRFWRRALDSAELAKLSKGDVDAVNTPDLNWVPKDTATPSTEPKFAAIPGHPTRPLMYTKKGFTIKRAFVQPLAKSDQAAMVRNWNEESFHRGREVYSQLCVTCHGTLDAPGSLPTAPQFHLGEMKNGADPYRMFQTLEKGYGQMVAQPQYTTQQKYDVIYYLREHFFKGHNETYLTEVDEAYLSELPRGMTGEEESASAKKTPQYLLQDFGNTLFWTLEVAQGNIAQKGIAIRVDEGSGGVSKGNAWMLYEHDTMRLAACWSGDEFVDWNGIAFNGSHGTHTSIVGEKHFVFPNEPMWANPETGDFEDLRLRGRDGLPYGPLPRDWVHFHGVEMHGEQPVIRYTVGDCEIREVPKLGDGGAFERHFYCGPSSKDLKLKIAGDRVHSIPAHSEPFQFGVRYRKDGTAEVFELTAAHEPVEQPEAERFEGTLVTEIEPGEAQGAWTVDVLEIPQPEDNPWQSWMRTSGFDFFEGGKSAAVCTWNGDVWIVDGIDQSEGELKWQRICSGLFQPLGLKIIDGEIHVSCRDMIAVLRDFNGDRETDFIENFNSDHQVTEHFHEFAMGLQADDEGNLYYAKSARHGKPAVVPHHGTLLKVSKDGSSTEILATGFRAANGVCLNPDGSFMVTDQEGNWMPKNRINWVQPDRKNTFYGNMWSYQSITDESDDAMNQPLCWITNRFDRSPAELLWVPEDSAWEPLRGSLLNLSYGEGRIYTVPFEKIANEVQGGMSAFPIEPTPTGLMRGRFSPLDGQLYGCGMFAWAGNRQKPGGFYRVRYTGGPATQPVGLTTDPGKLTIRFSDAIDPATLADLSAWEIRAWDLKRTKSYGSQHYDERVLKVSSASLSDDRMSVTLEIPELAPTWGMSIKMELTDQAGKKISREIHNSIFTLE